MVLQPFALLKLHLPEFIIQQMKIGGTYYKQHSYMNHFQFDWSDLILSLRHKARFKQGEVFMTYLLWYSVVDSLLRG